MLPPWYSARSPQSLALPPSSTAAEGGRAHRPWVCPQVIIVIYLSVVGALLLYMAFLMLVDPLTRKPDAYTEQLHNEPENEVLTRLGGRTCHPALHPLGPGSLSLPHAPVQCPMCHQTPVFSSLGTALWTSR